MISSIGCRMDCCNPQSPTEEKKPLRKHDKFHRVVFREIYCEKEIRLRVHSAGEQHLGRSFMQFVGSFGSEGKKRPLSHVFRN